MAAVKRELISTSGEGDDTSVSTVTSGSRRRGTAESTVRLLRKSLGPEFVSTRKGPAGATLSYLSGGHAVWLANHIFGNDRWTSEIKELNCETVFDQGKWTAHVRCITRVTVFWSNDRSSFHEDVGFGGGKAMGKKSDAIDLGIKEARTDSLKRTLRLFGEALGNCIYDKAFLAWVESARKQLKGTYSTGKWKVQDLIRLPCNGGNGGDDASLVSVPLGKVAPVSMAGVGAVVFDEDDFVDDDGEYAY